MCAGDFDGVAFFDEFECCFVVVIVMPGSNSGIDPEKTRRKEVSVVHQLHYTSITAHLSESGLILSRFGRLYNSRCFLKATFQNHTSNHLPNQYFPP
jgi:hypothetical protein